MSERLRAPRSQTGPCSGRPCCTCWSGLRTICAGRGGSCSTLHVGSDQTDLLSKPNHNPWRASMSAGAVTRLRRVLWWCLVNNKRGEPRPIRPNELPRPARLVCRPLLHAGRVPYSAGYRLLCGVAWVWASTVLGRIFFCLITCLQYGVWFTAA